MNLNEAQQTVIDDHDNTWDCDDCIGSSDALAHVCDVLRLPEEPAVMGSYPLQPTDDPELDEAYRVVLSNR